MLLNQDSSREDKKESSRAVYEFLAEALFEKISFISFPFLQARQIYNMGTDGLNEATFPWGEEGSPDSTADYLNAVEGPVTDTENYWGTARITNTSEGKFLKPSKRSRSRFSFYTEFASRLDGYILTPAVYDSFSSLTKITDSDFSRFRSYTGLKILNGSIWVVIKEADKEERLINLDIDLSGSASTTYRFDMVNTGKEVSIAIDNIKVATFPVDMIGDPGRATLSYLPIYCPVRSTTGDETNIVIENFQFIQNN